MKRIILASIVALISSIAIGGVVEANEQAKKEKNCRNLMEIAESVMTQRQNGASIAKLLDVNDFAFKNSADKTMKNVINHIIMDAFQEPYYNSPSLKRSQLTDFSAKYYIACMMM